MAREAYEKIGHFFDRTYESSSGNRWKSLVSTISCGMDVLRRAWEKYFLRHPQSKSEHARKQVAQYVVLISLDEGYRLRKKPRRKKPRQWEELVAIYRETATEMGLPESSPATIVTVAPARTRRRRTGWTGIERDRRRGGHGVLPIGRMALPEVLRRPCF